MKIVQLLFMALMLIGQSACSSLGQPRMSTLWAPGFSRTEKSDTLLQTEYTSIEVGKRDSIVVTFLKPKEWDPGAWPKIRSHDIVRLDAYDLRSLSTEQSTLLKWSIVAHFTRKAPGDDNVIFELSGNPSQKIEIIFR